MQIGHHKYSWAGSIEKFDEEYWPSMWQRIDKNNDLHATFDEINDYVSYHEVFMDDIYELG